MNNNSVNQKEIDKFSKMADQWWDLDGKFKILHRFNTARIEFITNMLQNNHLNLDTKNLKILDIGCGGGLLSEAFCLKGYEVTGIDAEEKTIAIAKAHAVQNNLNINYLLSSAEDFLKNNDTKFDIVFAMEIIEHVDNPQEFVNTICQLLKPNGLVFFSTINRTPKAILLAKFMAEYVLRWLPRGTHDFKKFITPSEINTFLSNSDITMLDINGINFNVITQKWALHKNPTVNYICYGKKIDS